METQALHFLKPEFRHSEIHSQNVARQNGQRDQRQRALIGSSRASLARLLLLLLILLVAVLVIFFFHLLQRQPTEFILADVRIGETLRYVHPSRPISCLDIHSVSSRE